MSPAAAQRLAAIAGFLAVALGAFGAHGLKGILIAHDRVDEWQKAALYHLVHAVLLLALAQQPNVARLPFAFISAGILLFSGSLYAFALTNVRWLVALTPIGGVCLLAGWLLLALRPPVDR